MNGTGNGREIDIAIRTAARAMHEDKPELLEEVLLANPELKQRINEPIGPFDSPAIMGVRSKAMLDVLLANGADLNARSRWWAGGFGLLHSAPAELAIYAVERGAKLDAHAAARLGLVAELRRLIAKNPAVVNEPGPDGQRPLHFAATIEIADFLLDNGAEIDAIDTDHESTAAQYMLADRQEVARRLVSRGCRTDLLMAAALGDAALAKQHLTNNPECIRMRVSPEFFPMRDHRSGGTIYQWVLGWHVSAPEVARKFGHEELFQYLMDASPLSMRLVNACMLHDEALFNKVNTEEARKTLEPGDLRMLAHAARNNDGEAAKLMLNAGFPVTVRGQHNGTPLHWAAWHGNAALVAELLKKNPVLEDTANDFNSAPLGWAIHGSYNGWWREKGDYPRTCELLLDAGANPPPPPYPAGELGEVLAKSRARRAT